MMVRFRTITAVVLVAIAVSLLPAQENCAGLLTLERIFNSREFASERFGPARWLADASGYTTLEPSQELAAGTDIVRYDPKTGARTVMVTAASLVPEQGNRPLPIADYSWSPDAKRLLIFTNTKRVWRQNTRGDYWVLTLGTGKLQRLGGDAEPGTLMFAKFSPDGAQVAYVVYAANNIYMEDLASGRIVPLTDDGSETIINGTFDWVYEEEFGLRDGFRWSPDGKKIAYWQLDASGVGVFNLINNTDSLYSKIIPIQYPKVGTTNSAGRIGVVLATGGETVWMDVEGDPRNNYLARMEWAAGSDELFVQYLNRLQNANRLLLCDVVSGSVTRIHVESDPAWTEVCDDVRWLNRGAEFTWISEADGWRRLYVMTRNGDRQRPVTRGDFDIVSVELIDPAAGWIYFIASPGNATRSGLYRKRLSGKGGLERLTPVDQPGSHSYQISPDGRWAIHTWSALNRVPVIDLVQLPGHRRVRTLVDNARLQKAVDALLQNPPEFFQVDIGDAMLDGYMIKPWDFDPAMKYPLLFFVYSEPAGCTVQDRWGGAGYLWHLMLAQQGYVIVTVDNRGTPAPKGREWRKSIYKRIGILNPADQAAAARVIREWGYIDKDRIGIWGWSGGGSATLNALFQYPDIYHTGMSVAPVPDQRLYDTIYQERYMGLPQENPEAFRQGSPITHAGNLKGNLLIVHGTGDDNVHFQGTERLINELIRQGKQFTMMAYPNRSHGIYEGEGTTMHLRELLTRYLHTNLEAGPRPR
ncbi:S9 family peptidase [bacterium]|nr:S9 family peptidase [bacterium]